MEWYLSGGQTNPIAIYMHYYCHWDEYSPFIITTVVSACYLSVKHQLIHMMLYYICIHSCVENRELANSGPFIQPNSSFYPLVTLLLLTNSTTYVLLNTSVCTYFCLSCEHSVMSNQEYEHGKGIRIFLAK